MLWQRKLVYGKMVSLAEHDWQQIYSKKFIHKHDPYALSKLCHGQIFTLRTMHWNSKWPPCAKWHSIMCIVNAALISWHRRGMWRTLKVRDSSFSYSFLEQRDEVNFVPYHPCNLISLQKLLLLRLSGGSGTMSNLIPSLSWPNLPSLRYPKSIHIINFFIKSRITPLSIFPQSVFFHNIFLVSSETRCHNS